MAAVSKPLPRHEVIDTGEQVSIEGLRAEYELIGFEMVNDYPEARSLRLPTGVPVVAVLAAPPGRLPSLGDAIGLGANDLAGLALKSPKRSLRRSRPCRPHGSPG